MNKLGPVSLEGLMTYVCKYMLSCVTLNLANGTICGLKFFAKYSLVFNCCTIHLYFFFFWSFQTHAEFSLLMGENLEKQFIRTMKPILEKVVKWPFSKKEDRDMVSKAKDMCKDDPESGKCKVSAVAEDCVTVILHKKLCVRNFCKIRYSSSIVGNNHGYCSYAHTG